MNPKCDLLLMTLPFYLHRYHSNERVVLRLTQVTVLSVLEVYECFLALRNSMRKVKKDTLLVNCLVLFAFLQNFSYCGGKYIA